MSLGRAGDDDGVCVWGGGQVTETGSADWVTASFVMIYTVIVEWVIIEVMIRKHARTLARKARTLARTHARTHAPLCCLQR